MVKGTTQSGVYQDTEIIGSNPVSSEHGGQR